MRILDLISWSSSRRVNVTLIYRKSRQFLEMLNNIVPGIPGAVFWGSYDSKNRVVRVRCKRKGNVLSSMIIPPRALLSKRKAEIERFANTVALALRKSAKRKLKALEETGDLFGEVGGRWEKALDKT